MAATAFPALPQPPYSGPESPSSFVPGVTVREILLAATTSLVLLLAEVLTSNPRILFAQNLSIDELETKLVVSLPSMSQSLFAVADLTPPTYHFLARVSWQLIGGSAETAFRTISFVSMWVALVLIYVLLRRTFAVLPALVAVLAFWSSSRIIEYTFYARSYASLLAAITGFCMIYGLDNKKPLATAFTAVMATLVCTLHYFGVFALAAVVLGDTLARREPLPAMIRRWLPAAAGPLALAFCWPLVRAWEAGVTVFTDLPPQNLGSRVMNVLHSWGGARLATAVLVFAWCISYVTSLIIRGLGYGGEKAPSRNVGPLQPVAGFLGLMLIPIFVAISSTMSYATMSYATMLTRYMIPGLLGVTVLLDIVAGRGYVGGRAPSRNIGPLQPVAGLLGLMLVPIFVAISSTMSYASMVTRYMIPGLLGLTVLLAIVASNTKPRILAGTAMLLMLLGALNLRLYSEAQMRWQAKQDQLMKIGQSDKLPIVTFHAHEAYALYTYAPSLRNRLFVADLRDSDRSRLHRGMFMEPEFQNKWLPLYPDLPKLVHRDQLRHMGKFHLVKPIDTLVLAEQETRPWQSFPLEKIAQALSFEKVGDLYEVGPN